MPPLFPAFKGAKMIWLSLAYLSGLATAVIVWGCFNAS